MSDPVASRIESMVKEHKVLLFMKGTPQFPQCGFSGSAVKMLKACGVQSLTAIDVLADPDIRAGIKAYSNWPTIPQLYITGELIGGADIVRELYQTGELQTLLDVALAR